MGILESAELTGNLDAVLNQLADYIERDKGPLQNHAGRLDLSRGRGGDVHRDSLVLTVFVLPRFTVFFNSLGAKSCLS